MKRICYFGSGQLVANKIENLVTQSKELGGTKIEWFALDELISFQRDEYSDNTILLLDLSPWDQMLFPSIIPTLNILQRDRALLGAEVYLILGLEPSVTLKASLAASPLIDYYFVIGGDEEVFFRFLFKDLGLTQEKVNIYATLNPINQSMQVLFPFHIKQINSNEVIFDSGVRFKNDYYDIDSQLFSQFAIHRVSLEYREEELKTFLKFGNRNFGLEKSQIDKEDFENYLNDHEQAFRQKMNSIGIVGNGEVCHRWAGILDYESSAQIEFYKSISECIDKISTQQPEILFLRIEESNKEENKESEIKGFKFTELPTFFTRLKTISQYSPVIMVLNSPSHSLALRQVFNYQKIMAFEEDIKRDFLLQLIKKFNLSFKRRLSLSHPIVPLDNHLTTSGWVKGEVILHEMNETEYCISSPYEIQENTWLHCQFPIPLTLKIISEERARWQKGYFTYRAKVLGLYGINENKMRVFVNMSYKEPYETCSYYLKHEAFLQEELEKFISDESDNKKREVKYGQENEN